MLRSKRLIARLALLTVGLGGCGLLGDDDDEPAFEVWAVDQSGTAGTLYVYDGRALAEDASKATPEVIDLGATVTALCVARTGSAPVRGHMMMFNQSQTHAILAYVATGHVVFFDAATRTPLECIDVGVQAHAAFPSPDSAYVVVANQNGKLLQRIRTSYATNTFTLEPAATLDLAACVTPSGAACEHAALRPDNAPICPVIDSSSRRVFTTLRGGGLFVVDATTTPMSILAEYDQATVRGNGCGGMEYAGKMYINAGGGTAGNPTENDLYSFTLSAFAASGTGASNTPAPRTVYALDSGSHDGHGAVVHHATGGRYLWVADRFSNEIMVVDMRSDELVSTFSLAGDRSPDPAPDLLDLSPRGRHVFASLRGPCPQTANAPAVNNSVGATPGVGVIRVRDDGRRGELVGVAPISSPSAPFTCATVGGTPTLTERADPHALNVRLK